MKTHLIRQGYTNVQYRYINYADQVLWKYMSGTLTEHDVAIGQIVWAFLRPTQRKPQRVTVGYEPERQVRSVSNSGDYLSNQIYNSWASVPSLNPSS